MPSQAKTNFDENKKDLDHLWAIHQEVAGQGPGRKYGVDVLNRTAIVFISAYWESFVEDLAKEAFEFMLANVASALKIPSKVRNFATKTMFEQKDSTKVWALADSGWKTVLNDHKLATFTHWVDSLNTPKSPQVNALYEQLIGIKKLSDAWHWQNMTVEQAETKLDEYITIRGNIAHRTEHNETVYKDWGTDFLRHVEHLVGITEDTVSEHLEQMVDRKPW